MQKALLLFVIQIILFILNTGIGNSQPSITWQRLYNSCYIDIGNDICPADDGNFFIAAGSIGTNCRGFSILKINPYGDTIWTTSRDSGGGGPTVSSGDGGCVTVAGSYPISVMKLNANGNTVWRRSYSGPNTDLRDIKRTIDGGYILCGSQWNVNIDGYALKIDSVGNLQWGKIYPSLEVKDYYSVEETIDGGYIMAGSVYDAPYGDTTKAIITKIDSVGNIIWEKRFKIVNGASGKFINRINGGYLFAGGTTESNPNIAVIYFAKIDMYGNLSYTKIFSTTQSESFGNMAILESNKYLLAISRDTTTGTNGKVVITDSLGNILQQRIYPGGPYLLLYAIQPASNGDLLFVGVWEMYGNNRDDIYVLRTDSILNAPPIGIKPILNKIPSLFNLSQNYPNPFNPKTKIRFSIPLIKGGLRGLSVRLIIYDVLGREVASLIPPLWGGQEGFKPGTYEVEFDGSNFASGIYFYRLIAGDFTETKKMVLLK